MRKNKTISNLQTIWNQLDEACGHIDNAQTAIHSMTGIEEIKETSERIDFLQIVDLKNKVEELIEEIKQKQETEG